MLKKSMDAIRHLLDTIAERKTFHQEDWLIVLCTDHGGYSRSHGMPGGNASTIPLLLCSRAMKPAPNSIGLNVCDIAPLVLKHFGMELNKPFNPQPLSEPSIFRFSPNQVTVVSSDQTLVSVETPQYRFSILRDEKGYLLNMQNRSKKLKLFYFHPDLHYDEMTVRVHPEGLVVFAVKLNGIESFISGELQ